MRVLRHSEKRRGQYTKEIKRNSRFTSLNKSVSYFFRIFFYHQGFFCFLQSSKPKSFTPPNRDKETINEEATNPSIIPVGTYHISIDGTVTIIPPRVPTIGKRPSSNPTANAVHTLEINEATNTPNANRFVLNLLDMNAFTMKNESTPITAMLKTFAPKVVIPPSARPA